MAAVTRRHLLVAGGAGLAATVLAACGEEDDPREEGRDPELLEAAYVAEQGLAEAYRSASAASGSAQGSTEQAALRTFARASVARVRELTRVIRAAGGTAPDVAAAGAVPPLELTPDAVAAYHDGTGLLSTEQARALSIRHLAAVAAEAAVLRGFDGEDPAPRPFVTGGETEPFVPEVDAETEAAGSGQEDGE